MAARKVQTPGVAETPVDLDEVLGAQEKDQSTNETSSVSEPVNSQEVLDALEEIKVRQESIESKLDSLLSAGGIEVPKKKRWVQGKTGLEYKEIK